MKKFLAISAALAAAAQAFAAAGVAEEDLGLRKHDLRDEARLQIADFAYSEAAAGESERFERAFLNAPPQIPHDVSDFLPITQEQNSCLGCHDQGPEAAAAGAAEPGEPVPLPASHYYDLREQKALEAVSQARYNCVQCHAPQANLQPPVGNDFAPDFRGSEAARHKSNLLDVLNEGVK